MWSSSLNEIKPSAKVPLVNFSCVFWAEERWVLHDSRGSGENPTFGNSEVRTFDSY